MDLPGIDVIINGHIHRRLDPVCKGETHWITAGNITRRARSDASREHTPAVVTLRPGEQTPEDSLPKDSSTVHAYSFRSRQGDVWNLSWESVPHQSFDEVFHAQVETDDTGDEQGSGFVADLRELTARRTESGAGLTEFLQQHLGQFEAPVAKEIMRLHDQVAHTETISDPTPMKEAKS
jgi:DNA repair exonuclease SbcCD nuclease subunit